MYCAVIGDLVDSRKIEDRYQVQEKLKVILSGINETYSEDIAANFIITLGDEFQGLFKSVISLMSILEQIRLKMHPVKVRFGIGFGDITTAIDPRGAIGADGPAFYAARSGVNAIKDVGGRYESPVTDLMIKTYNKELAVGGSFPLMDQLLSAASLIENKWTSKQREIIEKLTLDKLSQREIGEALEVSQANVHGRIISSGFYTYRYCMEGVNGFVTNYWEENHGE